MLIMDLKASDLYKKHQDLSNLKKTSYENIYKKCISKIKLTANTGELVCIYEIPEFLLGSGYSIINIKSCASYIQNKMITSAPDVKTAFIEPNIILFDWRKSINAE